MAAAAGLCVSGVVCHLLLQFGFQSRSLKAVYYLQQAGIKQVGGWVFRQTGWKQVRPLPLCVCVCPRPDHCCCCCTECSMLAANRAA